MTDVTSVNASERTVFGHPIGLVTLFLTEMWERFSYYGMRALLLLFMVDMIEQGGLGFTDVNATAIYGLYTAGVYLMTLPGGWVADRLLGAQRAIWFGGIIIMCGHFILAIQSVYAFFLGLVFVVVGTGLLKPNISTVVGSLYPPGDVRRDGGFTIFYMGINIGGALGPIICGALAKSDSFGWHWGFAAAGIGMLFGLIQFRFSSHWLGSAGLEPTADNATEIGQRKQRNGWRIVIAAVIIGTLAIALLMSGAVTVDPRKLAAQATVFILAVAGLYFAGLFAFGNLSTDEKKRIVVIIILFLASAMFWAGFEQVGSSLNLFADRYTDRMIGGFEIPTPWLQSVNPIFIIILAPFFSMMWISLAKRNLDPTIPAKFALGLILLGAGFAVMFFAAQLVVAGNKVLPTWLILTYLLHTMGELTLSPVGLSAMTKLAPERYGGQMMGIWFVSSALGLIVAGLLAGEFNSDSVEQMPALYLQVVMTTVGSGLLLALFVKPIRRLLVDAR